MRPIPVCLTVRNDIKNIEACLESLMKQDYPHKLFVHDANSNDGTFEVIQKFKPYKIFRSKTNISRGRNITLKEARKLKTKYVVIVNSDVVLPKHWIKNAVRTLDKLPECGALGSYQLPPKNFWERIVYYITSYSMISDFTKNMTEYSNIACEAACFKSEVFEKTGLFNENLIWTEDTELSHRIRKHGYKIYYAKILAIRHHFKSNLVAYAKQQFQYGRGWKEWKKLNFTDFPLPQRLFHLILNPWKAGFKEKNVLLPFLIYFYGCVKVVSNLLGRLS